MKLSLIIPTLNEEKYLPRLLESIKIQDFSDYEIIVSDGGSVDRTAAIAAEFGCRFISDSEHHSPSWQRNNGAAVAKGDILFFLDADSVLPPEFLKKAIAEFERKNLSAAGFYFRFNPLRPFYWLISAIYNAFCFVCQRFSPTSVGAAIMSKRLLHEQISGFNTDLILAEDSDYCARLSRLGKFRMITAMKFLYSSRRLERDGILKTMKSWVVMDTAIVFHFHIKGNPIDYDFGNFK